MSADIHPRPAARPAVNCADILRRHVLWLTMSDGWQRLDTRGPTSQRQIDALVGGGYLAGADLREAGLRMADLRGADLRHADLRGATLTEADLRDADLRWADLRGATLTWADLRGARLDGAMIDGADLSGATR